MKTSIFVVGAFLLAVPAAAQISAPAAPPTDQVPGRFISDDMNRQLETVDDRRTVGADGELRNSEGERLICRRELHQTRSRMARAPRLCLTAKEWRERQ